MTLSSSKHGGGGLWEMRVELFCFLKAMAVFNCTCVFELICYNTLSK